MSMTRLIWGEPSADGWLVKREKKEGMTERGENRYAIHASMNALH